MHVVGVWSQIYILHSTIPEAHKRKKWATVCITMHLRNLSPLVWPLCLNEGLAHAQPTPILKESFCSHNCSQEQCSSCQLAIIYGHTIQVYTFNVVAPIGSWQYLLSIMQRSCVNQLGGYLSDIYCNIVLPCSSRTMTSPSRETNRRTCGHGPSRIVGLSTRTLLSSLIFHSWHQCDVEIEIGSWRQQQWYNQWMVLIYTLTGNYVHSY